MKLRGWGLLLAATALLGAANAPALRVAADVRRSSDDLLAPITIMLSVENTSSAQQPGVFETADVFDVVALVNKAKVWDARYGQQPINVVRRIMFDRGRTLVQSDIWDGTTNDKRALPPGTSLLRVTLLTPGGQSVSVPIAFATPYPIAKLDQVRFNQEVTIQGKAEIRNGFPTLTDDGGSVTLSRRLIPNASGSFVVRGIVTHVPDGLVLTVERAVAAFDNLQPVATPSPTPQPLGSLAPLKLPAATERPTRAPGP